MIQRIFKKKKLTAISNYFYTSSRAPRSGTGTIWATARIQIQNDIEHLLNVTTFELEEQDMLLRLKRLQVLHSETPGYFQFMNNMADPLDVQQQIQEDIQHETVWVLYSKKPWERYEKVQYDNRQQAMLHKVFHIECEKRKVLN